MGELLWGMDLGGTKIEGVVLSDQTTDPPLCRVRIPTEANLGYAHIISRIELLLQMLVAEVKATPKLLGIGTPGVLDPQNGLLKNSNTVCLNGEPLRTDLEKTLRLPLRVANDANCLALAEARLGAARGSNTVFGVIMGTGVGGGVVIGGSVLYGCQGIAGEWGHNELEPNGNNCYCGKRGCVETVISGPALERHYEKLSGVKLSLDQIVTAARSGADPQAKQILERLLENFGKALSVVVNIVDPEVVVLGGGLSNIKELYTGGVEALGRYVFNDKLLTRVVPNELGDSAGVFGAALLCKDR